MPSEENSRLLLTDEVQPNGAFSILNLSSGLGKLYSLKVPCQVTYEVNSGALSDDYLNIITLSQKGSTYYREDARQHNKSFAQMPPHFHDYYEMMIVLEGSVTQYIEGNIYNYESGSVCFLNRNLLHKEQFNGCCRLIFLGFSPDYLEGLFRCAAASPYDAEKDILSSPLYELFLQDTQHPGEKVYLDFIPTISRSNPYERLHDLTDMLIDTLMNPRFGTGMLVDGMLCRLLSYVNDSSSYHASRVEISRGDDFLLFMRIVHLLEESEGRLGRAELSQHLSYSGDYLNRIIKKHTGLSLHEYNMKFAMKKAAQLLLSTRLPVSGIMAELSFTNRTYFYRTFENQYGMTPNEYRKAHRK